MILHSILAFLAPLVGFMPAEKERITPAIPSGDPLDINNFIAFLETKDPNEIYVFTDSDQCAMAQYADWCELGKSFRGHFTLVDMNGGTEPFPSATNGNYSIACSNRSRTFGGLLKIARCYNGPTKYGIGNR